MFLNARAVSAAAATQPQFYASFSKDFPFYNFQISPPVLFSKKELEQHALEPLIGVQPLAPAAKSS